MTQEFGINERINKYLWGMREWTLGVMWKVCLRFWINRVDTGSDAESVLWLRRNEHQIKRPRTEVYEYPMEIVSKQNLQPNESVGTGSDRPMHRSTKECDTFDKTRESHQWEWRVDAPSLRRVQRVYKRWVQWPHSISTMESMSLSGKVSTQFADRWTPSSRCVWKNNTRYEKSWG